jgi:hypothetical protein
VLVDGLLRVVDVADEVPDPAFGVELVPLLALALVDEHDSQALREERGLAQALNEDLARPLELVEDLEIRKEGDRRPGLLRRADLLQVAGRLAAGELLTEDLAVALDLDVQGLGQRVDHGHADTVEPAGDLVALAAELPAGVELRQDDRHRGKALVLHDVGRDARAVVRNGHRVVRVDDHLDQVGAPREGLVDGVVDDLEHEMMEASGARRADVHARSQADRLEALENGDVLRGVSGFSH